MKHAKSATVTRARQRDRVSAKLLGLALNFYRGEQASRPLLSAMDFVAAGDTFVADVRDCLDDLPEHLPGQKGKGRVQRYPSKRRKDLIAELHQFADFLNANTKRRRAGQALRIGPLKGRRNLSKYACEELLGDRIRPLRIPDRSLAAKWNPRELAPRDIDLIKQAFAAAEGTTVRSYRLILPIPRNLLPTIARELSRRSRNGAQNVPILDLVEELSSRTLLNLGSRARIAAFQLQSATEMWGNKEKDSQRNRTVTDFDKRPPIYQWIIEALEIGARTVREPPGVRVRLMAGDKSSGSFEERFSTFIRAAMKLMPEFALSCGVTNFDPLVGTDGAWTIKRKRADDTSARVARRDVALDVAYDFATRIVGHREQIVILGDYVETLSRWNLRLAALARSNPKLVHDRDYFQEFARNAAAVWRKDCEDEYRRGIFYSSDAKYRGNNRLTAALDVDMLRSRYPLGRGASQFADVDSARVLKLLNHLHSNPQTHARLASIFKLLDGLDGVRSKRQPRCDI
ncbi:hypothetical protein HU675_0007845 [Bradyrhizobium septentrionale]|uniref:hypothetical protein n=1 Tax=Bradyrhizobium septentrionale TaxID=1404411 RepID=UPI001596A2C3|nr:hypothetical protein [Bradyrhizobium septentrionale]UGY26666.1 hypothetical protein HU675_0007845 [Bradyrhizobium septentrionale]